MARAGYYAVLTGHPFGTGPDASRQTFVIAEVHIAYRSPAFFGEPLACECRVAWSSRSAFGLDYRVVSDGGPIAPARLVADGSSVQVMVDIAADRVGRVPADLLEAIERFEGHPVPRQRPGPER
jgi:acyl-CoA thioesterase FadM